MQKNLKDDALMEIFLRLPIESVHRFRCVSKHWLALLSDPYFRRCYIQVHAKLPSLFMLYHLTYTSGYAQGILGHLEVPPSKSSHTLSSSSSTSKFLDFSLNFIPLLRDYPRQYRLRCENSLKNFETVGVSSGLLLCKAEFKSEFKLSRHYALYVCNPLTKQWVELPHLERRYTMEVATVGFAYSSSDNDLLSEGGFTVLEVERKRPYREDRFFHARMFSSDTWSWSIFRVPCPPTLLWWSRYIKVNVVVHNDAFYWNEGTCIVGYDPVNQPFKCKLIDFPPGSTSNAFQSVHQSEGKLLFMNQFVYGHLCVWELAANDDEYTWRLKYDIDIPKGLEQVHNSIQTNQETVWLVDWTSRKIVVFNMRTGSPEVVLELPVDKKLHLTTYNVLPFEMTPWPIRIPQFSRKGQDGRT